jgi:tetratricopeptide (TPR) repeat protein
MRRAVPALVALLGGLAGGCAGGGSPPELTYNRDIAPIVLGNCAVCHRPGESAPFPLLEYRDVRKRAAQIAEVTGSRYMPPWPPEPGYVTAGLVGERRLSDGEIERIARWVEQGAVEGDPADRPEPPRFPEGWPLGAPDLVLEMEESFTLPAGGGDVFRNFVIPAGVGSSRWVRALDMRPGNKQVVHHANVLIDSTGASRRLDAAEPGPGFHGMELLVESYGFEPHSHFLFWKPGTPPALGSAESAWRLDPGSDLVLNAHLQPSGKPESIRAKLALYFSDEEPTRKPMLLQLESDRQIDIPPGARDFEVSDSFVLPLGVEALGVYPHCHYLCREVHGWATLPDGRREWLIRIDDWDFDWQAVYRYREPLFLPGGTRIEMRFSYDNSERNPRAPRAPRRVRAGNRSEDEMAHLWIQVEPRPPAADGVDGRIVLQEALMRARLGKHPGEFSSHVNLGGVLLQRGRLEEAAAQFRHALAARPGDPTALTNLGSTLQQLGHLEQAVPLYRRALAADPDYANARYDLGSALLAGGDHAGALAEFERLLRAAPDDVDVLNNLGYLHARRGDLGRAVEHYQRSSRLAPDDADTHSTLGYLLAAMGDSPRARRHLERALSLDPHHAEARRQLAALEGAR